MHICEVRRSSATSIIARLSNYILYYVRVSLFRWGADIASFRSADKQICSFQYCVQLLYLYFTRNAFQIDYNHPLLMYNPPLVGVILICLYVGLPCPRVYNDSIMYISLYVLDIVSFHSSTQCCWWSNNCAL